MSPLTPASLLNSLEALASAKSEADSRLLLVTAATLFQEAVYRGADPESVEEALNQVPSRLAPYLDAVLNRTVDFQMRDDGSCLGLWLVPVVVAVENASLPPMLPLETESLHYLKLGGAITRQMGLTDAVERVRAGRAAGWNYVVPCLYSRDQLASADIIDLVSLPAQALSFVRGEGSKVALNVEHLERPTKGTALYFLPVIVNHPEGQAIGMPKASDSAAGRIANWVSGTLQQEHQVLNAEVSAGPQPHPFSVALEVGERLHLANKVRRLLRQVSAAVGVHPHGMAALVTPYALDHGAKVVLGVTLASRLTKTVLANLDIPIDSDGAEESALAAQTLRDAGLDSVQLKRQMVESLVCQHCGKLQFEKPSADAINSGHAQAAKVQ